MKFLQIPWRRVVGEEKHDEGVTLATFASSSFYRVTELSQLVGNQIFGIYKGSRRFWIQF